MSGGTDAIAGAVERMYRKLSHRTGQAPALIVSGGAAVKLDSVIDLPFETVDTLIFDGLLQLQSRRLAFVVTQAAEKGGEAVPLRHQRI